MRDKSFYRQMRGSTLRYSSLKGNHKSNSNITASSFKRKTYYNKRQGYSSHFIFFPELVTETSEPVLFPELYFYP